MKKAIIKLIIFLVITINDILYCITNYISGIFELITDIFKLFSNYLREKINIDEI